MNACCHISVVRLALSLLVSLSAATVTVAQDAAALVERPVSFSADQARNGEGKYLRYCEECHGADLKGGMNGGALLRGDAFEEKWANGMPASVLYSYLRNEMPPGSPGRYSDKSYAEMMAYILMWNGFAEGDPLPSDFEELDYLIMEK